MMDHRFFLPTHHGIQKAIKCLWLGVAFGGVLLIKWFYFGAK